MRRLDEFVTSPHLKNSARWFQRPSLELLKLGCSRLGEIKAAKTQGIITTRRVSEGFTETLVKRDNSIPHLRFGL
jgi:hypothetical protein